MLILSMGLYTLTILAFYAIIKGVPVFTKGGGDMKKLAGIFIIIISWILGSIALIIMISPERPYWFVSTAVMVYVVHTVIAKEAAVAIFYVIRKIKRSRERGREFTQEIERVKEMYDVENRKLVKRGRNYD